MNTILIIRPAGPSTRMVSANGTELIEASVEQLLVAASRREMLRDKRLTTLILEDLRLDELPVTIQEVVMDAMRSKVSCPIVTRWTRVAEDDAR